jgi:hypothetical protein
VPPRRYRCGTSYVDGDRVSNHRSTQARWDALLAGLGYYYATTLVVVAAVWFAAELLPRRYHALKVPDGFAGRCLSWDGLEYAAIAERGYSYQRDRQSDVAFFPAYPLGARWLSLLTGLSVSVSLVVFAHACLLGAFVLFYAYARLRVPSEDATHADFVLLAMGLWPTGMFFRMGYSESLFLLVTIAAMYAMERGARPIWPGLIVGLATACRPVGIALLGPLALYLWRRAHEGGDGNLPRARAAFTLSAMVYLPIACWGIAGFMLFQHLEFGDALAFFDQHRVWSRQPTASYLEQLGQSLVLAPIWNVYTPSSPGYWASHSDAPQNPLLSLPFANPIFFLITVALIWVGWRKRWLNERELLLAALLLAIPYFTQGCRNYMLSQGRFAAVVFPAYMILGRLAARAPGPVFALCAALSALLLAVYAAQFAASYRVT